MNNNNIILRTHKLSKTYMQGKIPVHALKNVDLEVKKGEFVSITGPSGSGKSTLLSIIGCIETPTSGNVWIDGIEITRAKQGELPRIRREKIGFIFQHFNLIPTLTALENVEIPMRFTRTPKKERQRRAKHLLEQIGMADRMHHRPSELSGGEQQRVSIARALANRPAIILADEPTGEVDTKTRDKIIEILGDLSKNGQTVIVVTHDPEVAQQTQRTLKMRDGEIIIEDTETH